MIADLSIAEGAYPLICSQIAELNRWRVQHCERHFFACLRDEGLMDLMRDPPERFTPKLSVGGLADEIEVNVRRDIKND